MLKCSVCKCDINSVTPMILVVPVSGKPRPYCGLACIHVGEAEDQRIAINRIPHHER